MDQDKDLPEPTELADDEMAEQVEAAGSSIEDADTLLVDPVSEQDDETFDDTLELEAIDDEQLAEFVAEAGEEEIAYLEADIGRTVPLKPLAEDTVTLIESPVVRSAMRDNAMPIIQAVQRCNIGLVRSRNEDSSFLFSIETGGEEPLLPFGLYIVADGMGGHYAGHEASKNVSRLVAKQVLERIYLPLIQTNSSGPVMPQQPIQEVMLEAVQAANQAIHNPEPQKDSGTTLTAALIFGRRLYIAHVGDSRAYVLADTKLKQVTNDHSYVRRLQEAGQITEEEAASHPQRNMLYRAVGTDQNVEIDTYTQSMPKEGKLILCSDGLWGLVPEPIMKHVLSRDDIGLQEMADELISLAIQAGGHDNITVVLVDFTF